MSATSAYAPVRHRTATSAGSRNGWRTSARNVGVVGLVVIAVRFWRGRLESFQIYKNLESKLRGIHCKASTALRPVLFVLIRWVASLHTKLLEASRSGEERNNVSPIPATVPRVAQPTPIKNRQAPQPENLISPSQSTTVTANSVVDIGDGPESSFDSSDDGSASRFLSRNTKNHKLINDVLHYWFGQHTPDGCQKKLWMISSQSIEHRQRIDREITDKFGKLLLKLLRRDRLHEWCSDVERFGYRGKVAAIIVLDQFSRHILRYYEESGNKPKIAFPQQGVMDILAFQTAKLLLQEHSPEIEACMIPMPMYIFSLMPYRHQSTLDSVGLVQKLIEHSNDLWDQCNGMLGRFRKATNRRMAVLQDQDRKTGEEGKTDYTDDDILECFPFDTDMTPATSHAVVQAIVSFLKERGINAPKEKGSPKKLQHPVPVIVSLSGGVDSMVIASVLWYLKKFQGYNLRILAVHIDYANRPDSEAEANYVQRFCDKHEIEFHIRRIDELTRGVTSRDAYEKQTRQIRYAMYRDTVKMCQGGKREIGVFLGHHRGDLRENVLSNAHKGCGPLDLSGMTSVSVNDGVHLYRPLLPLEKTFVFDYAHAFGVPYFKDTTPHWSTRGKLRNRLLPLLEEIYGEGSMNNLSSLAVQSDECRELLHHVSLKPFLSAVKRKPMGIMFQTGPWRKQGLFFWKFVLRESLHSAGLGMWSDKSVESFLERVQAKQPKTAWLQCRRDYAVHLGKDGHVHIFYPKCFPFRKSDAYDTSSMNLDYSEMEENAVAVGPWNVSASWKSTEGVKSLEKEMLVDTPALSSFDWLMEGVIEYYLRVPTWEVSPGIFEPRPLVFRKFDKPSRPRAWKSCDLKVQETLPIVGNDQKAEFGLKDPRAAGCTHTNDRGHLVPNSTEVVKVTLRLATSARPGREE